MSTEKDEYGVYHIDGPPVAGFILAEHPDGTGQRVSIVYKTLRYIGTIGECEEAKKWLMNIVVSELQDLINLQPQTYPTTQPIIWWRHRPTIEQDEEDQNRWILYARFDTTPLLPLLFWEQWGTPESLPARRAREVIG